MTGADDTPSPKGKVKALTVKKGKAMYLEYFN